MDQKQLKKASKWLDKRSEKRDGFTSISSVMPVVNVELGHAAFCAYVYKIERADKSPLWFVMNLDKATEYKTIKEIKRICYERKIQNHP